MTIISMLAVFRDYCNCHPVQCLFVVVQEIMRDRLYLLVICRCEEGLLDNMVLGPNIAKNAALRENVFMMAICIELRIPLFLVGKPGSSKSLAKSIIQDSMHGPGSRSPVLRDFKQVSKIVCKQWLMAARG